ncbi:MAG: GNAT family N-acetyltransferase, partial [Rhodospirillaceae bacterium]|nr:GNAT family N-acetyltransferase [Rhodospirillaceae bacterium]
VDLPVSLDFESGYGRAPDEVSAGAGARGFFAPSLVDERLIGPLASRHGPYRRSGQGSSLDRGGLIRVMAGEHSIEVLDGLPAEIERTVEAGHLVHEQTHGVVCAYKLFSMVIRGEGGAAIAVLTAYTAYAEVYVDDIWVDEHYRGQGLGTKLLTALEERYRGQGYNNINLVTSAFQAADFYLKCGFEIEFFRQNQHNPELTKTFMVKFFDGVPQHRGTLGKDQGR